MYLTTLDRDFDRMVRRTFGPAFFGNGPSRAFTSAMPMDTLRSEGELVLRFDVPGVDPEKIDVTVDRGVLTERHARGDPYRGRVPGGPRAPVRQLHPARPPVGQPGRGRDRGEQPRRRPRDPDPGP